jgi:hypothetical protein
LSQSLTINGLTHARPDASDAEWGGILSSSLHGLSYSKRALLVFQAPSGLSTSARGMRPGYEAVDSSIPSIPVPFTGKLIQAGLHIRARTAPDANLSFDLRKNGSSITGFCQLNSGSTNAIGGQITSLDVAAGDLLSLTVTGAGGYTSGGADLMVSFAVMAA